MIKILKNVPIPATKRRGPKSKHQDLHDVVANWEVGDCVVFEIDAKNKKGYPISSRESVFRLAARRRNQKTTSRKNEDTNSITVWRIE
tara:strand:+ start:440 stop:703 length:264 start_codon:yes stop_codon:yes gene_type:complete